MDLRNQEHKSKVERKFVKEIATAAHNVSTTLKIMLITTSIIPVLAIRIH